MTRKVEVQQKHLPETASEHGTGNSWSDIAADTWSYVKNEGNRLITGQASLGEYGAAVAEAGIGVVLATLAAPEVGAGAAIGAAALYVGLGTAAAGEAAMFVDLYEHWE